MLIICEGLDRTGKSTIVSRLVNEHGFIDGSLPIDHGPGWREREWTRLLKATSEFLKYPERDVVVDRWHMSQAVYRLIDDDWPISTVEDLYEELEALLAASFLDTHVLFLDRPYEGDNDPSGFSVDRFTAQRYMFDRLATDSELFVHRLGDKPDFEVVERIVDNARKNRNELLW